jgi:hypothetical protein
MANTEEHESLTSAEIALLRLAVLQGSVSPARGTEDYRIARKLEAGYLLERGRLKDSFEPTNAGISALHYEDKA